MKTYKVIEEWIIFREFLSSNLNQADRRSIGFLYHGNEILIRCNEESTLNMIRRKYTLTLCELPNVLLDKKKDWVFVGNYHLFDPMS